MAFFPGGLFLLPLIAAILTGNKVAAEEKKVSDRSEAYTSTLRDSLGGFSVIKSFKAEAQMIRDFGGAIVKVVRPSNKKGKSSLDSVCKDDRFDYLIEVKGDLQSTINDIVTLAQQIIKNTNNDQKDFN